MIRGSSNHPVSVIKISINVWTFRDELEVIIAEKLAHAKTEGREKIHIREIMGLYTGHFETMGGVPVVSDTDKKAAGLQLVGEIQTTAETMKDSSGNEMDDAAKEMLAAIQAENKEEAATLPAADVPATDSSGAPMDDAAREMLAAIQADQPGATSPAPAAATPVATPVAPAPTSSKPMFRQRPKNLDDSKIASGVLFLSDIDMSELSFFSNNEFIPGQSVVIEMLIPGHHVLGAEVITCTKHNIKSRVIGQGRLGFRLRARFTFATAGERTLLRQFLKSIEPDRPASKKKTSEGEPDLSGLGL